MFHARFCTVCRANKEKMGFDFYFIGANLVTIVPMVIFSILTKCGSSPTSFLKWAYVLNLLLSPFMDLKYSW